MVTLVGGTITFITRITTNKLNIVFNHLDYSNLNYYFTLNRRNLWLGSGIWK